MNKDIIIIKRDIARYLSGLDSEVLPLGIDHSVGVYPGALILGAGGDFPPNNK